MHYDYFENVVLNFDGKFFFFRLLKALAKVKSRSFLGQSVPGLTCNGLLDLTGMREFVIVSRKSDADDLFNSWIAGFFSGAILGRLQGQMLDIPVAFFLMKYRACSNFHVERRLRLVHYYSRSNRNDDHPIN